MNHTCLKRSFQVIRALRNLQRKSKPLRVPQRCYASSYGDDGYRLSKRVEPSNRYAATVLTTQPAKWNLALEQLRNFPRVPKRDIDKRSASLLILFSKGFASLVGGQSPFVDALVRKVFTTHMPKRLHVYLAVVDRIPATAGFKQKLHEDAGHSELGNRSPDDTCEGWSMILLDKTSFTYVEKKSTDESNGVPHISITARNKQNVVSTVKLPVTNTLFENGRENTLLATYWHRPPYRVQNHSSDDQPQIQTIKALDSLAVTIDSDMTLIENYLAIPHERLTAVRKVNESLGNVVKALSKRHYEHLGQPIGQESFASRPDNNISASAELQEQLNSAVDERYKGQIFAAVAPKKVLQLQQLKSDQRHAAQLAKSKDTTPRIATLLQQGIMRYLRMGLDIRRVVGGGGEWGSRAALITLQPDALFDLKQTLDFDNLDFGSDAFAQHLLSTSVAPEGHFMQFFAAANPIARPAPPKDKVEIHVCSRSSENFEKHDNDPYQQDIVHGLFGGVSAQGMGISSHDALRVPEGEESSQEKTSTVDIPGATFVYRFKERTS